MARKLAMTTLLAVAALSAAAGGSFTNDLKYLKGKWRTDVTDKGSGLDTDGVLSARAIKGF